MSIGYVNLMYNAFRHSLGSQLLDMGYSLDHVRDQLGHTDIRTTLRYAKRKEKVLTDALEVRKNVVDIATKKPLDGAENS